MNWARSATTWLAYGLLVAVVAFTAWFINDEFNRAQEARCEVANLEFGLAALTVTGMDQQNIDEQGEAIPLLLERAAGATQDICEGTGIEPSTITPGEDTSEDGP